MTADESMERALDAAVRHHFDSRHAVGLCVAYEQISERSRRIVREQLRSVVSAVIDAAMPDPTLPQARVLPDAEALRDHLDALNDSGEHPIAVGWDATPQPFLITLVGPYAESEEVLFDSPWQSDLDLGERIDGVWVPHPPRCDDCQAHVHGIEDLRFPATVLAASAKNSPSDPSEEARLALGGLPMAPVRGHLCDDECPVGFHRHPTDTASRVVTPEEAAAVHPHIDAMRRAYAARTEASL